jgi:hypothetical protein
MAAEGLFSVNWKNPMLLGAEHLQLADLMAARTRNWLARAVAHPAGHYGLAPPFSGTGKGVELSHDHSANHLTVSIQVLTALAPDGTPLVFDEAAYAELQRALATQIELAAVVPEPVRLSVLVRPIDPSGVTAEGALEVGDPDPAEEPPRAPLRTMALELVVEPGAISSGCGLKVAEFTWDGAHLTLDEDYIPPCLSSAAWPGLFRLVHDLRGTIQRLRDILRGAAADDGEEAAASLLRPVVLPMLAAVASIEDELPERDPRVHPYQTILVAKKVLRVVRTLLAARPAALDHATVNLVQPGKLDSGDTHFFEALNAFLKAPYDHENLGPTLASAHHLLAGACQVVAHLLGAQDVQPVAEEDDPAVYLYNDKKYRLATCGAREFQINTPEPWHVCHFRDMNVASPRSLLLVCDRDLLVENPRGNAGLWMLDRHEKIIAKMFRVGVDVTSDPRKVVAQYTHIGEPTVTAVSVASSGLLDLSDLGPESDDRLRIYVESS